MDKKIIKNIKQLGFTWETRDPFLFCVHHLDNYPAGNDQMGPAESLDERNIGEDFIPKDGWRMYHGETVPGFPAHPHRGFETVTVVLKGLIDHSDSHGAAGRYGNGDVQWMTAGKGLQHSEMFPLIDKNNPNPLELFQIWLNLPKAGKLSEPYFSMIWSENIALQKEKDKNGKTTEIKIIAGKIGNTTAIVPAPDSWANKPENEVGIWLIKMETGAQWTIPPASHDVNRSLYFYRGEEINVNGTTIKTYHSADLEADSSVIIENGKSEAYILILQGKPINEPVVQYGPFVMNSKAEIEETFNDFNRTQFGGWPWPNHENVHPREKGKFAKYPDGREETR